MWPFILTRSMTFPKRIRASKAEVLGLIQDPEETLRLSPLLLSVVQDDNDPAWYTLTDRLPMLGGLYDSTTTFRCRWQNVEDGVDTEVFANAGTRVKGEMRVLDSEEEGVVEFREVVVVNGLFFLMPFIASTIIKAHIATHDIIADKVLQKRTGLA